VDPSDAIAACEAVVRRHVPTPGVRLLLEAFLAVLGDDLLEHVTSAEDARALLRELSELPAISERSKERVGFFLEKLTAGPGGGFEGA
jgi:hypothetical protein